MGKRREQREGGRGRKRCETVSGCGTILVGGHKDALSFSLFAVLLKKNFESPS